MAEPLAMATLGMDAAQARPLPLARVEPALPVFGAALAFAAALLLYRPLFDVSIERIGPLKYGAHALFLLAIAIDLVCDAQALPRLVSGVRRYWPLALLSVWVIGGSLYARLHLDQQETYLAHGVGYLGFFIAYPFARKLARRDGIAWAVRVLPLAGAVAFLLVPLTFVWRRTLLHESAFLYIPWAAYVMLRPTPLHRVVQAVAALALLAVGPLSLKNTATVVAAMSLAGVYVGSHAYRYGLARTFAFVRTWTILAASAAALLAAWALAPRPEGFSTGNTEFRTFIWDVRWHQFLASPLVGQSWAGLPYIPFTLFQMKMGSMQMSNLAVTHNDHLDLIANGGIACALLMLGFHVMMLRMLSRLRGGMVAPDRFALITTLGLCCAAALFAMAGNPVLGNPANGLMVWTLFGLLAGYGEVAGESADDAAH